jgi:HAD superfamily hydrolase (TIGR01450 family)
MTPSLPGVGPIDTIVCDIDGVVVLGGDPIEGAGEALQRFSQAGMRVLFVTNNSTKSPATIADRLTRLVGFETREENVINSGAATARFIADKVDRVYVLGTDGLRDTLRAVGIEVTTDWRKADAVVSGLDFSLSYESFVGATLAVQHGATFYATNIDATYPAREGQYPGAGAISAVVERATGQTPIVCGKPHLPMRRMLEGFGGNPLIVGDRPETDIALGKEEGWGTVLVLTGVTSDPEAIPAVYRPDAVVNSLAELPDLLGM